jgi:flagella basal body P-ring formation protein FlgA
VLKLALVTLLASISSTVLAQQVDIRFRGPTVSTSRAMVRLEDIAELSGGDPAIRHKLAGLDLEEFSQGARTIEIPSETVRYRAILAGIPDSKFHIAPRTNVIVNHWQSSSINGMIEQAIAEQISSTYQIALDNFEFKLITPVEGNILRQGLDINSLTATAPLPADLPVGQRNFALVVADGSGQSINLSALGRVTVYRELAMAQGGVAKGEALNETNVSRVRRPVTNSSVAFASYEQAIGKIAQADLQPFSLIQLNSIRETPAVRKQPDVRRNSLITIIIRQGNLTVTLKNARANENGCVGETISFINPVSNKLIYAKLVDSTTAVIDQ